MTTNLDLTTLAWCLPEIRSSLLKAEESLQAFFSQPDQKNIVPLQVASKAIYQASGALRVIGLQGVELLTDEAKVLITGIEKKEIAEGKLLKPTLTAISASFSAVIGYLESLEHGQPEQPLYLFPYYRDLLVCKGIERVHPSELFFPKQLATLEVKSGDPVSLDDAGRASARTDFERGLLKFLRGTVAEESAGEMFAAVSKFEAAHRQAPDRQFWLASIAFFEGLKAGAYAQDALAKKLLARFNLHLKVVPAGAAMPDKLHKEVLFSLACAKKSSPMLDAVREAYGLANTVPSDYETPRFAMLDRSALALCKDSLAKIKALLDKVVRGSVDDIVPFSAAVELFSKASTLLPIGGLQPSGVALKAASSYLKNDAKSAMHNETMLLELATVTLFAETILEEGVKTSDEQHKQGLELAQRVDLAVAGRLSKDSAMPAWLQVLSQSAQERITVSTFITEAQINLRNVEKALDTFFRDPTDKKGLAPCGGQLRQVAGALALLGHADAMSAAQSLAVRVDKMSVDTAEPAKAACDAIADSLGSLGFFVDRLGQKDDNKADFKFDAATGAFSIGVSAGKGETLPNKVVQIQIAETPATVTPVAAVASAGTVAAAAAVLAAAPKMETPKVETPKAETPKLEFPKVDAWPTIDIPETKPVVEVVAEVAPVAKKSPAEMTEDEAADAELREIFLLEAQEVLEAIEENSAVLLNDASNEDAMTTIRRSFHTLKGSSRMVGLNEFGEGGWAMEQLLNSRLSDKKPASPEFLTLVAHAHGVFTGWVNSLEQGDASVVQPADLIARADAMREGKPYVAPTATVDVPAAVSVAVPVVEAAIVIDEPVLIAQVPAEIEVPSFVEPMIEVAAFEEPEIEFAPEVAAFLEPEIVEPEIEVSAFVEPEIDVAAFAEPEIEVSAFAEPSFEVDAFSELVFEEPVAVEFAAPLVVAPLLVTPLVAEAFIAEPIAEQIAEPIIDESALFADEVVEIAAAPVAESDEVQIGDTTISRALFNIFLSEADDMLGVLRADADDWMIDASRSANKEARRAVHSIAGSANLVGLSHVSDVSHQVDLFLQRHLTSGVVPSETERSIYHRVVDRLSGMLHQFAGGKQPKEDHEIFADAVALAAGIHADQPIDLEAFDADQVELSEMVKADMLAVGESTADDEVDLFADENPVLATQQVAKPVVQHAPVPSMIAKLGAEAKRDEEFTQEENHFDADLLPVFIEEAEDYLPQIATSLRMWLEMPDSNEAPRNLMRLMHTVKGSARMAGAMELGQRVHEMETRIEDATDAASHHSSGEAKIAVIERLLTDHDHVVVLFDKIKDPSTLASSTSAEMISLDASDQAFSDETDLFASDEPVSTTPIAEKVVAAASVVALAAATTTQPAMTQLVQGQQQTINSQLVRVRADLLDRMVSDAGEASIARSRVENELTTMRQSLSDLSENVSRLRTQLREIEVQAESQIQSRIALSKEAQSDFDPLEFDRFTRFQEVSRMLAESVNDVATVQQNSMRGLDEANRDLQRQSQVMRELQQNLMRIRLVQVGSIGERLYRVVRQAAKETNKKVNLDIRGSTTEIDRSVLERMASAFEHLLRNAVAHGIESPEKRLASRKSETGEIVFEIKQTGNEIVVVLSDNGGGLDYPRIRERAISRGLIVAGSNPSERELAQMIFMPGFSTATVVTEIAGRGVGMDVVRSEVAALGGRLDTESTVGLGTRFTITLPLSLAVTQVVVVQSGDHRYAIASASVEQVLQLKPQALVAAYADQGIEWLGERVQVVHLASLLDLSDKSPIAQHYSPVVIVKVGERRVALHVDTVTKNQEVVLKNMGPQLSRVHGVVGATVMGNGDIVLIINPILFADRMGLSYRSNDDQRMAQSLLRDSTEDYTVMVVDDSVTVRKVSQRFLAREGYQVVLAKDGVDALRQLQDVMPDVMLVDIEMPRMDGYDFTRAIRADQRLKHIPIIMITSRTADKHRNYALSLGVNAYMGKPYSETDLAETIKSFVGQQAQQLAALN
jgi:chemosensory pili system protein ChpA (sensor histidine kinase/response regulator)